MAEITIANATLTGRKIGQGHSCFIVAELSGNHGGSFDRACRLIEAASDARAEAVKTQCFTPDSMTLNIDAEPFRLTWAGRRRTLYELYSETAMPLDWHARLKERAESLGLLYFASVFDNSSVDLMHELGVSCYKIASFELADTSLISYAASKGKPLILSTGMANRCEIQQAIEAADDGIKDRMLLPANRCLASPAAVILLKCTTSYPAPASAANLRTIPAMRTIAPYRDIVGLSDHTCSNAVVSAAVGIGACVVERHLKLSDDDTCPDAAFSDTPERFAAMVMAIRDVEAALGEVHYGSTESEQPMLRFRRSLWVIRDVRAGEPFTADNVRSLRPAVGIAPSHYDDIIGKRAARAIAAVTALDWGMVG